MKVELLGRREGVWLAVTVLRAWLGGMLGWMLHCICIASVGKSTVRGDVEWPVRQGVQKDTNFGTNCKKCQALPQLPNLG